MTKRGRPIKQTNEVSIQGVIAQIRKAQVTMVKLIKAKPQHSYFLHRRKRELDHLVTALEKRK